MKVFHQIDELSQLERPAHLAIGVFDGVHLGHQEVIRRALEGADKSEGNAAVVTFDPHPMGVLQPHRKPRILTSTPHKEHILAGLGVDALCVVRFDKEFSRKPAAVFVDELRAACRPLAEICVGRDWEFGFQRSGNVQLLREMGEASHFKVTGVEPVTVQGQVVSSTRVREAVQAGDLEGAALLLGREYTVLGTVIEGRRLGRTIGFPTANLSVHSEQLPPSGVYAVQAALGDRRLAGVGNLGMRPTVEDAPVKRMLEVHLFDFSEDIYGRELEIMFAAYLRPEEKFESIDLLKRQIASDARAARDLLA